MTHWGYGGYAAPRNEPMAIWSLCVGIASFVCLGPLLSLVAIGLGLGALSKIRTQPDLYTGKGLAIAGVVLGTIELVIFVLLFVVGAFAPTIFGY